MWSGTIKFIVLIAKKKRIPLNEDMVTSSEKQDRVQKNTSYEINWQIASQTEQSVQRYATKTLEEISARIDELYKEWDIEQWLQANAAVIALSGIFFALIFSSYWLLLSTIVLIFLLQHAIQGWCPPIIFLRWLNIRTQKEIDEEIYALKVLRGDFLNTNKAPDPAHRAEEALTAVRR